MENLLIKYENVSYDFLVLYQIFLLYICLLLLPFFRP